MANMGDYCDLSLRAASMLRNRSLTCADAAVERLQSSAQRGDPSTRESPGRPNLGGKPISPLQVKSHRGLGHPTLPGCSTSPPVRTYNAGFDGVLRCPGLAATTRVMGSTVTMNSC